MIRINLLPHRVEKRRQRRQQFYVIAAAMVVLGALVGDALGAAAIAGINGLHLKMPPPPGAVDPIDLQLAFVPEAFVAIVAVMAAVLLVAAIAPVLRATRISVVEALRHV